LDQSAATANSAASAAVNASTSGSWSDVAGTSGAAFGLFNPTTLFDSPGAGFNSFKADLYEMRTSTTGGNGTLLGTFTLSPAGVLTFSILGSVTTSAPVVTTQPTAQTVVAGGSATFTVVASGTPAPTYQWKKDGTAISGATNATYTIASTVAADAGSYSVTLTNSAGTANSDSAALTVNTTTSVAGAPTITTQPIAQTVASGSGASFSVVASGTPAPTLQWKKDGVAIAGATNATFSITSVQASDAGSYAVTATNTAGAVTSNSAVLALSAAGSGTAPTIATQPANRAVALGTSVTFTVVAQGTPEPTYQWKKNGTAIAGATGAGFTIASTQAADAGSYTVTVTNPAGSLTSNAAVLSFASAPVVITPPASLTVKAGESATLTVVVSGSPAPVFQWTRNAAPIPGANSATLTIAGAQVSDSGTYGVIVANAAGAVISESARLTVMPPSFAGIYFLSFGPGRGTAALYVRADNSAVFTAFLSQSRSAIVTDVKIGEDGKFAATGSEARVSAAPSAVSNPSALLSDGRAFVLSGQIAGPAVSGRLTGLDESFVGSSEAVLGTTQSLAGHYAASAVGSGAGRTYLTVGTGGQALIVTVTPTTVDGGMASVTAAGSLVAVTAGGGQISAQLNPQTKMLNASLVAAGGATTLSFVGVSDTLVSGSRLRNLSTRGFVGAGGSLTPGFVMKGVGSKQLVIRAIGSALAQFPGISTPLDDPKLELVFPQAGGTATVSNDDWGGSATLAAAFASVGAFPLPADSKDAAIRVTLASSSGGYSASVSASRAGASGIALVEIYDADPANAPVRLVNVSTLGFAGSGEQALALGFVIEGNTPKRVLLRAVGPGLSQFPGQGNLLADPQLQLLPSGQPYFVAASNNDWGGTPELKAAFTQAGAFGLPDGSKDAALVVVIQPGAYTVAISGVAGTTGRVLVEIYDLDP